ncbi:helix-turn-helix domain-containing protein [Nocardia sp. NPDC050712]|uniref:TetR/AcrR family transcriptional regulator n=1 Tax=Nocardia sp. NPDC050712 TaxID=3155518 RepID=UPI0033C3BE0D
MTGQRRQSRDVVANRAQIVAAAARVLEEQGMRADMRTIAKAAGLGIGTLYRHFATREDLLRAITESDLVELAETRLPPGATALEALRAYYAAALTGLAGNRALLEILADSQPSAAEFAACVAHLTAIGSDAVERARHDHTLAADITATDIAYQFLALVRIVQLHPDPDAIGHHIDIALRGLHAGRL